MNRSPTTSVACASALALILAACAPSERPAAPGGAAGGAAVDGAAPAAAELAVHDAWARSADSAASTAVYFTLHNGTAAADTLLGVTSADAEASELHESRQRGGTMHMAAMASVPVAARERVPFAPMGKHVMLVRTARGFTAGDTIVVTLRFASGRTLEVRAGVRQP